jgi:hypothetical protein
MAASSTTTGPDFIHEFNLNTGMARCWPCGRWIPINEVWCWINEDVVSQWADNDDDPTFDVEPNCEQCKQEFLNNNPEYRDVKCFYRFSEAQRIIDDGALEKWK